jgi:hypothetical protein
MGGPGLVLTFDYGSFSSSCRVVWLTSFPRVDSAMLGSSISFLTRASVAWLDSCFGSFLCILARCHECKGITGQFGTGLAVSALFSYRAILNSLYQSATCSISNVKQRVPLTPSESWTVEDEQCQKIGGGYKAVKFRFLLFLWMEPTFYLRRSRVQ